MKNININIGQVISASRDDGGDLHLKFVICDFNPNENKVRLNRDNIDSWLDTLVNKPLVCKINSRNTDFTSHMMRTVRTVDEEGNIVQSVKFDTNAYGVFTSVGIEDVDDSECIVAEATVWSRFEKVCEIILSRFENGTLHGSWEIAVAEEHSEDAIKVIDMGEFTAFCLLGANVPPAFESARLMEVASADQDDELIDAYSKDIEIQKQEDTMANKKKEDVETVKETVPGVDTASAESNVIKEETSKVAENANDGEVIETSATAEENNQANTDTNTETASLTDYDIRRKLEEAVFKLTNNRMWLSYVIPAEQYALFHPYDADELSYILYPYEISDDDEVILGEPVPVHLVAAITDINNIMAQKDDAIAQANERINELEAENATLVSYKEKVEKIEREEAEKELSEKRENLKAYALRSGLISEKELSKDKAISKMIAEVDENGIKQIIANRYMDKLNTKNATNEVASKEIGNVVSASLEKDVSEHINPIQAYINK